VALGWSLADGTLVAAFIQDLTVGSLVKGLPFANGQCAGDIIGWLSPFAVLCQIGVCVGYSLLGSSRLVRKCEGETQEYGYRLIPKLALGLLAFLIIVFVYALTADLQVVCRWLERPYLLAFSTLGVVAAIRLRASWQHRWDAGPFAMVSLIFVTAFPPSRSPSGLI
jgi:cytochrome d ubiquinol oxidase subunit II